MATVIDDEGTQVVAARLPFGWPADSGVTADIIEAAMELAIDTARHATAPFGAALLDVTTLRAFSGGNTYFESGDRFAHAETNVLRAAMSTGAFKSRADIHRRAMPDVRGGQRAQRSESHHLRHINRDPYPVRLVPNPHQRFGCGGGLHSSHASIGV